MPKSTVEKGDMLSIYVASQIVEKGLDQKAKADGRSGASNREKGDISTSISILGQNAGIECKNHAKYAIEKWWGQTKQLEKLRREPVLAFKNVLEPVEETKVVIYLDTLLELLAQVKELSEGPGSLRTGRKEQLDRDLLYKAQNAGRAFKELAGVINNLYALDIQ